MLSRLARFDPAPVLPLVGTARDFSDCPSRETVDVDDPSTELARRFLALLLADAELPFDSTDGAGGAGGGSLKSMPLPTVFERVSVDFDERTPCSWVRFGTDVVCLSLLANRFSAQSQQLVSSRSREQR